MTAAAALLERRAAALATPPRANASAALLEVVAFCLGSETYALESGYVFAVFRLAEMALLPGAPAPVHGVTLWNGELTTVLDVRSILGISASALNDLARVIVVGADRPAFGILADSVEGIRRFAAEAIHAREAVAGVATGYVTAMTTDAVLVLDAERLLHLSH
jgi:purine-binding chemotaxis protein CheW